MRVWALILSPAQLLSRWLINLIKFANHCGDNCAGDKISAQTLLKMILRNPRKIPLPKTKLRSVENEAFFGHSDVTWNQCLRSYKFYNAIFCNLGDYILVFWWISNFIKCKNSKKSKFRTSNCVKMAIFEVPDLPTLVSRKIWVIEKLWNFYIFIFFPGNVLH